MKTALRPLVLVVALAALVAAGCGGQKETVASTALVVDSNQPGGPDYVKSKDDPAPGNALLGFIAAAHAKDPKAMWDSLSTASQQRVGPTYAIFREKAAKDFIDSVGAFVPGKFDVVTSAVVDGEKLAVASVAGTRKPPEGGELQFETFGAPLYRQDGKWRLEIFGPGELSLLVPEERTPQTHVAAAVGVDVGQPVLKVGMWFDGKQYDSPTEGPSPTEMTIFAEPTADFEPGNHTVMALVDLGNTALATSWTFIVGQKK